MRTFVFVAVATCLMFPAHAFEWGISTKTTEQSFSFVIEEGVVYFSDGTVDHDMSMDGDALFRGYTPEMWDELLDIGSIDCPPGDESCVQEAVAQPFILKKKLGCAISMDEVVFGRDLERMTQTACFVWEPFGIFSSFDARLVPTSNYSEVPVVASVDE